MMLPPLPAKFPEFDVVVNPCQYCHFATNSHRLMYIHRTQIHHEEGIREQRKLDKFIRSVKKKVMEE